MLNSVISQFSTALSNGFQTEISAHLNFSILFHDFDKIWCKGPFLYYVRTYGWVGGPENGNFPLLYVVIMSLRRWVGGSKKPQNTLT